MPDSYCYFRVRADHRDCSELLPRVIADTVPAWEAAAARCWGIWQGLLGLAANELLMMAAAPADRPLAPLAAQLPEGATLVDALELRATVRPEAIGPLPADGIYVFRFFEVKAADCDEVVELSRQAWESFETSAAYRSRPQGLFRPRLPADERMLLVTWYDGFDSWERSRTPAPQARDNFRRRHALTGGTVAYAARLLPRRS